ncbi:hypothetical protein CYJ37_03370 [Bacillus sp. UMB0728]|nr:hypothetical protein CYJ37_03370 [Bacillus sp. UMB0728]
MGDLRVKMRMCGCFGDFQGNSGCYYQQLKHYRNFIEFTAVIAGCLVWLDLMSSGQFLFSLSKFGLFHSFAGLF